MAVDTRKFSPKMFYRPQIIGSEYVKSELHRHLEAISQLPTRIKGKADFIIADTAKGSFKVVEIKERKEPINIRRYVTMHVVPREQLVESRLERLEEQFNNLVSSTWSYLFSERAIEEMKEISKGMLEGSKKMRELAEQLQEAEDEG